MAHFQHLPYLISSPDRNRYSSIRDYIFCYGKTNDMDIKKGVYQHYKGNRYRVLGTAFSQPSDEMVILYQPLYECEYEYFTRPLAEFMASVTIENKEMPRFTYIGPYTQDEPLIESKSPPPQQ